MTRQRSQTSCASRKSPRTVKKKSAYSLEQWKKTLRCIPGYDSFGDADGFAFDVELANRAVAFIETQLVLIEGDTAGKPFILLPWQRAFIGCLFGWVDAEKKRRYREAMLYIPRKNGKSPLCAAILDYVLLCDGEEGAQCYCAAADKEQANIVFRHARGMIERNDEASRHVTIYNTSRQIVFGHSFARVISADAASSKHGYNSHLVIIDELHAQPDRELVDVLTTSTSTRRQPLIIFLTTADYDRPSICNERHSYALKVRDGVISDPRFLPVIFEATDADDWESEDVWTRVNPSMGTTKSIDYMRRECERAHNEPSYQATFRRLELNQKTSVASIWLDMGDWDACGKIEISEDSLLAAPCWAGLDLANSADLTALALAWVLPDGIVAVRAWHWIPADKASEKAKAERVPYDVWIRDGIVEDTPGNVTDYSFVRRRINELSKRYKIKDIACDPWNATHIVAELREQDGISIVEFRQGFISMSGPAKEFERLVKSHKLAHGGNPIMRWQASNVVVRTDPAGNIKPDKGKATQKIDGIVASIMALGRATVQSVQPGSVYENRGILFV